VPRPLFLFLFPLRIAILLVNYFPFLFFWFVRAMLLVFSVPASRSPTFNLYSSPFFPSGVVSRCAPETLRPSSRGGPTSLARATFSRGDPHGVPPFLPPSPFPSPLPVFLLSWLFDQIAASLFVPFFLSSQTCFFYVQLTLASPRIVSHPSFLGLTLVLLPSEGRA